MKYYGYTLVEVLIAVSILVLLFTAGYANYRGFARRQALYNATKIVQGDIRIAQSTALAGQLPSDAVCNGVSNVLDGYFFRILSSTQYEIRASCSGGVVGTALKTASLPENITFSSPFPVPNPIVFKVLGHGTNISNGTNMVINLVQANTNASVGISVSYSGQVDLVATTPGPTVVSTATPVATTVPTAVPTAVPTSAPTSVPTPTPCNALSFLGGNVSPSTVNAGGAFTLTCNYGVQTNGLTYVVNSGSCTGPSWSGTIGTFNCTAGTATPGPFANRCRIVAGNAGNYCGRVDNVNSLIVQ